MIEGLANVAFLNMECDEFNIEVCTTNYINHNVVISIDVDSEHEFYESILFDDEIDELIRALESAKDLKNARLQQNEPTVEKIDTKDGV